MISRPRRSNQSKSTLLLGYTRTVGLCCLSAFAPLLATGCSTFGNNKLVKQLQNENDRLLTEFRAERKKREEAERTSYELESRLAESEKLLAQQAGPGGTPRLSSLNNTGFSSGVNDGYGAGNSFGGQSSAGSSVGNSGVESPAFQWLPRK